MLLLAISSGQIPMETQEDGNQTLEVTEFLFLGFSQALHGQSFLFLLFLLIYLITIVGNLAILALIQMDPRLYSPMYFFLSHLSFLDLCYSSVTVPQILVNFLHQRNAISYNQCMAQMFFLLTFAGSECALLAAMAYDRYAAICQPLRYSILMSSQVRVPLALASWVWGLLDSAIHTSLATKLSFCGSNRINHIFCDVPQLLRIACSDTYVNEMVLHLASIFVGISPFLMVVVSYVFILSAILRIRSNSGRRKAFSTCTAHLTVVVIYFGMANVNYNRPKSGYSLEVDTLISTLYCVVAPMMNPIIYSLRNKEVKEALQKIWVRGQNKGSMFDHK
uniref:Olfactory receptor n=2 Tax=Anolis carolinensis TaxID=28377 RepID=L7MZD9_ANOCA|nr:PREDICTED: olfactory receptor 1086-like [Anolis carolinensis]|eukprot:XP_003230521.2 PREDICTED: olfactory receptor 1086-like [Anolis carolinensis]